jgi:hypothetical protein
MSAGLMAAPSCDVTGVPTRAQILQDLPSSTTNGRITAFVTVAGTVCTYQGYVAAIPLMAEKALINGRSVHLRGRQYLPAGRFTSISSAD